MMLYITVVERKDSDTSEHAYGRTLLDRERKQSLSNQINSLLFLNMLLDTWQFNIKLNVANVLWTRPVDLDVCKYKTTITHPRIWNFSSV